MMFCEYLWCKSDELSRARTDWIEFPEHFQFCTESKTAELSVVCVSRHHRSRVQSFSPYSDTLWYASCRKGDEEFTCKIRKSACSIGTTVIDIQIKALLAFEFHVTINAVCVYDGARGRKKSEPEPSCCRSAEWNNRAGLSGSSVIKHQLVDTSEVLWEALTDWGLLCCGLQMFEIAISLKVNWLRYTISLQRWENEEGREKRAESLKQFSSLNFIGLLR